MTWKQDDAHTNFGFAARHMMFSTVRGHFDRVKADVELDPAAPEKGRATVTIQAASVSSGDAKRDAHLRSADFFDAEHHPLITFTSTSVRASGDHRYKLAGDLTIRGVTKTVVLDAELNGVRKAPWGTTVAGVSVTGAIDRRDWGLVWNVPLEGSGLLVSEQVKLEIDLELVEEAAVIAAAA